MGRTRFGDQRQIPVPVPGRHVDRAEDRLLHRSGRWCSSDFQVAQQPS